MAEGLGVTGMPYPTYGVTPAATAPPMATAVSEPVASSSTYTGICESMPLRYNDDYHRPAKGVYMTDLTQQIRATSEPLIPLQGSPTTMGASPHRLQASHLVAAMTHTLGGVRS